MLSRAACGGAGTAADPKHLRETESAMLSGGGGIENKTGILERLFLSI